MALAELLPGILGGIILGQLIGVPIGMAMSRKRPVKRKPQVPRPEVYQPTSSKKPISVSRKRKPIVQTEFKEVEIERSLR